MVLVNLLVIIDVAMENLFLILTWVLLEPGALISFKYPVYTVEDNKKL